MSSPAQAISKLIDEVNKLGCKQSIGLFNETEAYAVLQAEIALTTAGSPMPVVASAGATACILMGVYSRKKKVAAMLHIDSGVDFNSLESYFTEMLGTDSADNTKLEVHLSGAYLPPADNTAAHRKGLIIFAEAFVQYIQKHPKLEIKSCFLNKSNEPYGERMAIDARTGEIFTKFEASQLAMIKDFLPREAAYQEYRRLINVHEKSLPIRRVGYSLAEIQQHLKLPPADPKTAADTPQQLKLLPTDTKTAADKPKSEPSANTFNSPTEALAALQNATKHLTAMLGAQNTTSLIGTVNAMLSQYPTAKPSVTTFTDLALAKTTINALLGEKFVKTYAEKMDGDIWRTESIAPNNVALVLQFNLQNPEKDIPWFKKKLKPIENFVDYPVTHKKTTVRIQHLDQVLLALEGVTKKKVKAKK